MRKLLVSAVAILSLSFMGTKLAQAQNPSYEPPNSQQPSGQPQYGQPPYGQPPSGQPPADGQQGQQSPQMDTDAGVARASFIHGDVSMQRGDNNDLSAVTLNTPLMSGDKISTGGDSRTELQLDFANILRLDSNAGANLITLTRSRIQLQISQGLANYTVLKGSEVDVEIDTPNVSVRPHEGRYRIEVNADGDTLISVREGDADVSTPEGGTQVHKGQLITIRGGANDAQYRVTDAPGNDDWDKWNKDRDGVIYNAQSYQHTNRYYTGAGDLDGYGTWSEVPDYGPVWVPSVDPGWAPYRAGRWVYEPYYGWTWVSEEPWGWAPYHYGRWFVYGGSWAWWPGPVYGGYRPIWAPAYVSFFGFGGGGVSLNFGFGRGFGSIGWLPIGPCDSFHPWWGGYRSRFDVVDIRNVNSFRGGIAPLHGGDRFSNLHNVFNNDRLRAGVSGVSSRDFGRGSVAARPVGASDFRNGRMMTGNLPVSPSRESMRVSDRPVSASTAARFNNQQRFFSGRSGNAAQSPRSSAGPSQGWNRFDSGRASSPQQQGAQQNARQNFPQGGRANDSPGARQADGWQRFSSQPRPDSSRDSSRGNNGAPGNYRSQSSNNYRPPLDMSKPIVDQRSFGNGSIGRPNNSNNGGPNNGPNNGSTNGRPSNGPPNGDSNNGAYRGGSPAPSYRPPSTPNPRNEGGYTAPSGRTPGYQDEPSYRGGPGRGGPDRSGPDRGGYRSAPSYQSAPSNRGADGGRSSAPSYQSAPSYRGGGGGGAPSYRGPSGGGGGGGGSNRGSSGGRSSGGGGGGGGRSSGGSGRSGGHR